MTHLPKFLAIPLCFILAATMVAMRNDLPPSSSPLEPLAMTALEGYQLVTVSSASDTITPKSLTANCPAGKVAIGGGAHIGGTSEGVVLTASGPNTFTPPTQWVVEAADTEEFSQNWQLNGYVYCVNQSAPIATYQVVTSSTASNTTGSKTTTASCPGGTTLIGGGARITGLVTNEGLTQSSPNSTSQPAQWIVAAHEINPSLGDWALHAYAFCTSTAYAGPVLASSATNTNTSKSITATCSPGGVLIGGGGQVTGEAGQQALIASRPGGGWVVEAHKVLSSAPAQNWGLRSYAFCVYHTYLPDIVK